MSHDIDPALTGWHLAQEMARPGAPLNRLGELCGYDLALVMAHRADVPLDRLGELYGYDLAWVMARRADARLDRLGELHGTDLAWVLARRADAGGIHHPNIGGYQVWEWRDTLTIGCATHSIAHWREHVEEVAALHGESHHVPAIRDLLDRIGARDEEATR